MESQTHQRTSHKENLTDDDNDIEEIEHAIDDGLSPSTNPIVYDGWIPIDSPSDPHRKIWLPIGEWAKRMKRKYKWIAIGEVEKPKERRLDSDLRLNDDGE